MQIEGRDDDQPGSINSQISYSIVSQEPQGVGHMFRLDEKTGKLYVKEPTLDREVKRVSTSLWLIRGQLGSLLNCIHIRFA